MAHQQRCIFCEGGGTPGNRMTGEHLWSDWMSALLPALTSPEYVEYKLSIKGKGSIADKTFERSRQGSANTKTMKVVCHDCNTTWMSGIEDAAKPWLTPLILGQPVSLDVVAKNLLAQWIMLKVHVAENNFYAGFPADPIYPLTERQRFKEKREPPPFVRVWICPLRGIKWQTGFYRHVTGLSPPPAPPVQLRGKNAQSVTFGIGSLLVHVFATTHPPLYPVMVLQGMVPPFNVLWPLTGANIEWTGIPYIMDQDADLIARSLADAIRQPNVLWLPESSG